MTRATTLIMGSALALVLGLVSSTAMAEEDIPLGKHSADDIKSSCQHAGARFLSDGQTYGCKKQCTGGTCAVLCDKDNGCFGITPANRRQGANGERGVLDVLSAKTNTTQDKGFQWGLLGLLGLAGVLGVNKRHDRQVNVDARRDTRA